MKQASVKGYLMGLAATVTLTFSLAAVAETAAEPAHYVPATDHLPARSISGEQTRRLLDLQRRGELASPYRQYIGGDMQQRIYTRYLNSFEGAYPSTALGNQRR